MRHIRDMHSNFPPTIAKRFDAQGIVKVLGIDGVDGEGQRVAEVATLCNLLRVQGLWNGLRFFFDRLGEGVRQSIFMQNRMYLGIVITPFT